MIERRRVEFVFRLSKNLYRRAARYLRPAFHYGIRWVDSGNLFLLVLFTKHALCLHFSASLAF